MNMATHVKKAAKTNITITINIDINHYNDQHKYKYKEAYQDKYTYTERSREPRSPRGRAPNADQEPAAPVPEAVAPAAALAPPQVFEDSSSAFFASHAGVFSPKISGNFFSTSRATERAEIGPKSSQDRPQIDPGNWSTRLQNARRSPPRCVYSLFYVIILCLRIHDIV